MTGILISDALGWSVLIMMLSSTTGPEGVPGATLTVSSAHDGLEINV